jgi:hypothetical protein
MPPHTSPAEVIPLHRGVRPIPADHLRSIFEPRQFPPIDTPDFMDEDEGIRAFVRGGHDWLVAFGFGFGAGLLAVVVPAMVIAEWVK